MNKRPGEKVQGPGERNLLPNSVKKNKKQYKLFSVCMLSQQMCVRPFPPPAQPIGSQRERDDQSQPRVFNRSPTNGDACCGRYSSRRSLQQLVHAQKYGGDEDPSRRVGSVLFTAAYLRHSVPCLTLFIARFLCLETSPRRVQTCNKPTQLAS